MWERVWIIRERTEKEDDKRQRKIGRERDTGQWERERTDMEHTHKRKKTKWKMVLAKRGGERRDMEYILKIDKRESWI